MPRKYVIFGLVALALLMSSIDNTIVAVALPAAHFWTSITA